MTSRSRTHFLQIAQLCSDAGHDDEALEWAERGVQAFPKATNSRLREFLAELYYRRSRHTEAMDLIWAEFAEQPSLEHYQLLESHAERVATWADWRTPALAACRESIVRRQAVARPARYRWETPVDGSQLVRIFMWEGELETAWQEARALGCSERAHKSVWCGAVLVHALSDGANATASRSSSVPTSQ